jgi:hypothetical protein
MDEATGDPRLLVNRVFTECLIRSVDVDLDVGELEARIHLFVKKSEKGSDALWSFVRAPFSANFWTAV